MRQSNACFRDLNTQSLSPRHVGSEPPSQRKQAVIFVVDDDSHVRDGICDLLETEGRTVEDFASCESFLEAYRPGREACLLVDAYLPGMTGLELLQRLQARGDRLPAIMITGNGDVPMAVQAMRAGASDFIEKPVGRDELLASVERALVQARDATRLLAWRKDASERVANLTPRQHEIMELVLTGHPSRSTESRRAIAVTMSICIGLPQLLASLDVKKRHGKENYGEQQHQCILHRKSLGSSRKNANLVPRGRHDSLWATELESVEIRPASL